MATVKIPLNQEGRIIGQHHHRAKLSDSLVQKLRDLHEHWGLGWRRLSAQFELNPVTVKKILAYERRNSTAVAYRYRECKDVASTAPTADASSRMSSPPTEKPSTRAAASGANETGSSACPQPGTKRAQASSRAQKP